MISFYSFHIFCKLNSNTNGNTIRDRKGKLHIITNKRKVVFYMSKKGLKLGVALAAGAGAAAILAKTSQENKEIKATKAAKAEAEKK